jgi:prepilin signal peptidase PulO-like enzyme (type II secretory pathway)
MMLMIIAVLIVLGLCFGSFVNALVWRVHEQAELEEQATRKKSKKAKAADVTLAELSIIKGRSMCPHCHHTLSALDLLPLVSWLALRGKCRYCHKPISAQYPVVELLTAVLFVISYLYWPVNFDGSGLKIAAFIVWLPLLVGFMALIIYDFRWMLLPDRIVFPLGAIASVLAGLMIASSEHPLRAFLNVLGGVIIGGGLFWLIYQFSKGKWIGGGDVKLGWLLGLVVGTPGKAALFIFGAAILGTVASLPLLVSKRLKGNSVIPFGPFLIIAAIIAQLFGAALLAWYQRTFHVYPL